MLSCMDPASLLVVVPTSLVLEQKPRTWARKTNAPEMAANSMKACVS